jgi:hypothetical protein
MVDGDGQCTVPVHLGHLAEKIRPMIRPAFQDVELPLMNHFVGQGVDDFLLAILASLKRLLEQREREANFALGRWAKTVLIQPWPWAETTHEHTD